MAGIGVNNQSMGNLMLFQHLGKFSGLFQWYYLILIAMQQERRNRLSAYIGCRRIVFANSFNSFPVSLRPQEYR